MLNKFLVQLLGVCIVAVLVFTGNVFAESKSTKKPAGQSTVDETTKIAEEMPTVLRTVRENKNNFEFEIDADNLGSMLSLINLCKQDEGCDYHFTKGNFQYEIANLGEIIQKDFCNGKINPIDRQECLENVKAKDIRSKILNYIKTPAKVKLSNIIKYKTDLITLEDRRKWVVINAIGRIDINSESENFPNTFKESWIKDIVSITGYDFNHQRFKVFFTPTIELDSKMIKYSKFMRLQEALKNGPVEARVTGVLRPRFINKYYGGAGEKIHGFKSYLAIHFVVRPEKVEFFTKNSETPFVYVDFSEDKLLYFSL